MIQGLGEAGISFLPKKWDGDVTCAVCLREADMAAFKIDEGSRKWARFVG